MSLQVLNIALQEYGVAEIAGPGTSPRIREYHSVTILKAINDETPWCSSFLCWCFQQAGLLHPRSAWARDWLEYGEEIEVPELGCIAVFSRDGGGHVGLYITERDGLIYVLGGNQGNRVSIAAYAKERLLGYRRVK